MVDNVQLNQATTPGAVIATDDVGGAQHQYVKLEFGADGTATPVDASNPLPVTQRGAGVVSTVNSTSTPLNTLTTFTGTAEDVSAYASVAFSCKTDQDGVLYFDFSTDGSAWDSTLTYNVTANINEAHRLTVTKKYFRIRFYNSSAVNQTFLRIQAILGSGEILSSPLNLAVGLDADAINVRPMDLPLMIQRGLYSDITFNNKFGRNANTAAGDAIWAASTAYTEPATAELCNVVSTSVQDDAGGGTGAGAIFITGIDENYDIVTETVQLNGIANVSTVNKYWNIHRAYVSAKAPSGTDAGAIGTITITSTAAGSPVIGALSIGYNQTQSTVYMVPRGYTAYINLPNVAGQNTTANATCDIVCMKKDFGGVFRIQMDFHLTGGTTAYHPKVFGAPLKWEEKSTILFKAISVTGAGVWDIAVDYDIWLVKNS